MKVVTFLCFLIGYFLYAALSAYFLKFQSQKINRNPLLLELFGLLLSIIPFFLVFLIGGFFDLKFIILLSATLGLAVLIHLILSALVENPKTPIRSTSFWAGINLGIENKGIMSATQIFSLLILIVYPISMALVFFKSSISVETMRILSLKFTLIMILLGFLITLPFSIGILTNGNIDEDTRAKFLISHIVRVIPFTLFISMFYWFYNIDESAYVLFEIGNIPIVYSIQLLIFLFAFLILFGILPYVIGHNKANKISEEYTQSTKRITDRIKSSFELSSLKTALIRTSENRALIASKFENLLNESAGFRYGLELETIDKLPSQQKLIRDHFDSAKSYDKRYIFYKWLNEKYNQLGQFEAEFTEAIDLEEKKILLTRYQDYFKNKYKELNHFIKEEKKNHKIFVFILSITTSILTFILAEFGNLFIKYFNEILT